MAPFTGWIVVAVRDVDAAAAWYKQKLELPESRTIEDEETGGLELSTRNLEIKVLLFAGEPRRDVTYDDRLTDGFCGHADRNAGRKQQDVRRELLCWWS